MNWWSSLAWCKANGMHLATMYELCPSWDGTTGSNKCSGVTSGMVWTATASEDYQAYCVGGSYVHSSCHRNTEDESAALCAP